MFLFEFFENLNHDFSYFQLKNFQGYQNISSVGNTEFDKTTKELHMYLHKLQKLAEIGEVV